MSDVKKRVNRRSVYIQISAQRFVKSMSTHVVQVGETLTSIAVHNNVTALMIQQANHRFSLDVVPGETLVIPACDADAVQLDAIDSQIFNKTPPVDGLLMLLDAFVRFEPHKKRLKPLMWSLVGFVCSEIEPHPCEIDLAPDEMADDSTLSLITVKILSDLLAADRVEDLVFTGKLGELKRFQSVMERRAHDAQEAASFTPPPAAQFQKPKKQTASSIVLPDPVIPDGASEVITSLESGEIKMSLPRRFQRYQWSLLYRISRDGSSYTSISQVLKRKRSVLILIRTRGGERIGAFAPNGVSVGERNSMTNGEAFVFAFTPELNRYKWARTSQFTISLSTEAFMIGGAGSAAIWIDGRFLNGFSERCNAFNSPQLTTNGEFKVSELELWFVGDERTRI